MRDSHADAIAEREGGFFGTAGLPGMLISSVAIDSSRVKNN
jgi:hypothetical protein